MTAQDDSRGPAAAAVVAVVPAFLQLLMLLGSWWPAAALAEALPHWTGPLGWRVTGLAPPLALWIGWRGTDAPKARRPKGWMYALQRGAVAAHLLFLGGGFAALAGGASPEVPWTWAVYSAGGVVAALTEWRRAGRGLQDAPRVVPIVRNKGLLAECEEQELEPPLHDPLAGDLIVVYALDLPRSIRQLQGPDLPLLGVDRQELATLAAANLRTMIPRERIERREGEADATCLWVAGGTYESSLLVLPELWESEAAAVQGDLLACVPARDLLVTGDSAHPGARKRMRRMWAEIAPGGDHVISATILKWAEGRWVADDSEAA